MIWVDWIFFSYEINLENVERIYVKSEFVSQ